ncbi:MAG: tRNA (adenosine(37)-N6)-threonylcarbamoyltransferase complex ATPase subunit type 1 TsaE [Candidatus Sericytochromatia bacterium]|nr:tRNA (adenosine(37)-N6)-threonylcarbamoyltransferase complex ATPase subunit type 1 TsaE [Candidatus Sericytochromatia bacterium]
MHDVRLTLADAAATQVLGEALGRASLPADILWLEGDLGAGKTTLVQGLGRALDVPGAVTSPTFALVQEHEGRLLLRHIDLYRLDPEEVPPLGPWEWFEDKAVVVVEWPDRLPEAFTPDVSVSLVIEGDARAVRLRTRSPRGSAWLREAGLLS